VESPEPLAFDYDQHGILVVIPTGADVSITRSVLPLPSGIVSPARQFGTQS
jgi:hypothetical protein